MSKLKIYAMTEHTESNRVGDIRFTACLIPKIVVDHSALTALQEKVKELEEKLKIKTVGGKFLTKSSMELMSDSLKLSDALETYAEMEENPICPEGWSFAANEALSNWHKKHPKKGGKHES